MNTVKLNTLIPRFISDAEQTASEIWHQEVSLCKGENCLVAARSGAGKSSLLAYVYGERNDYQGQILFDKTPAENLKSRAWNDIRRTKISAVFQGLRLFPELTAYENVAIKNRLTNHKTESEIRQMLEFMGLAEKTESPVALLSFGQQQRVAIVRALCQPFDFLLLDEPFSHLDGENIKLASEVILREKRDAGLLVFSLGETYCFDYQKKFVL